MEGNGETGGHNQKSGKTIRLVTHEEGQGPETRGELLFKIKQEMTKQDMETGQKTQLDNTGVINSPHKVQNLTTYKIKTVNK